MILLAIGTPWLGRLMAPRIADVWGGCVMNERTEAYALFDPRKDEAADRGLKTECLGKRCIIQVRGVSPTLAILTSNSIVFAGSPKPSTRLRRCSRIRRISSGVPRTGG